MKNPEKIAQVIVAEARTWLFTPYQHQASLKGVGCDCLGFFLGVWRFLYGSLPEEVPPYAPFWTTFLDTKTARDPLLEAAKRHLSEIPLFEKNAGDVLLFCWKRHLPSQHIALLTGKNTMIHAQSGCSVSEVPLTPWWARHVTGCFRFKLDFLA